MKKVFLTMAVMALFAIGFAASDEEESSNSGSSNSAPKTEQTQETEAKQKQETEAERQAREKKEQDDLQAKEKQEKIKKIADMAYQKGWNERMGRRDFPNPKTLAEMEYLTRYGVEPTKSGEEERWTIFSENYVKGYEAAWEEIQKKMHSEDL